MHDHPRSSNAQKVRFPSLWRLLHAGALQGRMRAWAETVAAHGAWGPVAAESGIPA